MPSRLAWPSYHAGKCHDHMMQKASLPVDSHSKLAVYLATIQLFAIYIYIANIFLNHGDLHPSDQKDSGQNQIPSLYFFYFPIIHFTLM